MCNTRASQISALTLSTRVPSCGSFVSQFSSSSSELSLTLASSLALSFQEARAQRGDLAHEVFVGHPKESENGGIFTSLYYLPVLAWVTNTLVETVMVYIFEKGLRAVNITYRCLVNHGSLSLQNLLPQLGSNIPLQLLGVVLRGSERKHWGHVGTGSLGGRNNLFLTGVKLENLIPSTMPRFQHCSPRTITDR